MNWTLALPELALALSGLAILGIGVLPRHNTFQACAMATVGALLLTAVLVLATPEGTGFGGQVVSDAFARFEGRRLPTEPEWELAALTGAPRGFAFGDVFEWVGGSARPWPGHPGALPGFTPLPAAGRFGVLRGASWMTPPLRAKSP